ncbi:Dihydrolipoyllysine-residue acetyltransferase component of pyruvate dehydrogenase complex [Candidatus Erwinia haradaeae]|uniref:Dihydrolipoamide acetyltransferase component of pyruvate dehydrogenase complex n=1 Tax=Candidatus Erwinia haradaeae TaxID=1922217 RepID=A0A451DJM1_9GAMM|nr:2-oxo acid dehydrogenase subunit E2 [Candidatus Erwinia haradaeae]VFP86881.1 Dihydrolipoyllysine-residue acetyltransferase component of pyruvate dehydrogenase complex [Candidatus Erwinia haradaeae]
MTIAIPIPDIGTDLVEVTDILVKIGDTVKYEQPLLVIEGDKASMEVPSPQSGVVKEIQVNLGDKVHTGQVIMRFETIKETSSEGCVKHNNTKVEALPTLSSYTGLHLPECHNDPVKVIKILVTVGHNISAKEPLVLLERKQQALIEIQAPLSGKIHEIKIRKGESITTGMLMMIVHVDNMVEKFSSEKRLTNSIHQSTFIENHAYIHATPFVRRLARLFNVNLDDITGTGHKSRILQEDVMQYIQNIKNNTQHTNEISTARNILQDVMPWPKIDYTKFGKTNEVSMSRIQKISGANLKRNWLMIPHVTHFDKIDITDLEIFRKKQNGIAIQENLDVKLTPLVFIIKAVAMALKAMPRFNSSISLDEQTLILKEYIHISIAIDTPNGLLVPVLKDVNKKGIIELSHELRNISQKARNSHLTAEEMQGGCFTISSIGRLGTTHFTPIINAPEVAILGISKFVTEPLWNGNKFIPRLMMPISLSFDHRVIDGADGARFITILNKTISDIRHLVM